MGWGLWIGLGIVAIGGYIFVVRPMMDPDIRGLIGGTISGDKRVMNENMADIVRRAEAKDPKKAAEIRARDPAAYERMKSGNAFYGQESYYASNSFGVNGPRLA